MLVSANSLKHHVAGDKGRYALGSLHISHNGVTSTDGRILLVAPLAAHAEPDTPACLVPTADAAAMAAIAKKADVEVSSASSTLTFSANVGTRAHTMSVRVDDPGQYPDVGSVIPTFDPTAHTYDLDTLIRGLTKLREVAGIDKGSCLVSLRFAKGPIGACTANGAAMLLMNCEGSEPDAWAKLKAAKLCRSATV